MHQPEPAQPQRVGHSSDTGSPMTLPLASSNSLVPPVALPVVRSPKLGRLHTTPGQARPTFVAVLVSGEILMTTAGTRAFLRRWVLQRGREVCPWLVSLGKADQHEKSQWPKKKPEHTPRDGVPIFANGYHGTGNGHPHPNDKHSEYEEENQYQYHTIAFIIALGWQGLLCGGGV